MNSGGHRGFTVVTIVTLIFSPIFAHHRWFYELVSRTSETQTVQCVVNEPCPAHKTVVNVILQDSPKRP